MSCIWYLNIQHAFMTLACENRWTTLQLFRHRLLSLITLGIYPVLYAPGGRMHKTPAPTENLLQT